MSVWTTKSSDRDRKYIVIKHRLKNIDYSINGIKFRGGYAVVEKDSKVYNMLKKIAILRGAEEYPLIHLRKLPFITRTADVKTIFGQDVYNQYIKELEIELQKEMELAKIEEEEEHINEKDRCAYRRDTNTLCKFKALEESPSHYCLYHLLEDPKLEELGIHVPTLAKDEIKPFKMKVRNKLIKLKKSGKF